MPKKRVKKETETAAAAESAEVKKAPAKKTPAKKAPAKKTADKKETAAKKTTKEMKLNLKALFFTVALWGSHCSCSEHW